MWTLLWVLMVAAIVTSVGGFVWFLWTREEEPAVCIGCGTTQNVHRSVSPKGWDECSDCMQIMDWLYPSDS